MIQPAQTSTRRSSCPGFPVVKLTNAARTQASASDITSCFRNEKETLFRLAFLITGDKAQAEASVINAYETTLQGETPFRDWVFEWAKSATVRSAIRLRLDETRRWESGYKDSHCEPGEAYAYNLVQILRILEVLPLLPKAAVATASFAGLREGELRGVEWPDFSDDAITVICSIWKTIPR